MQINQCYLILLTVLYSSVSLAGDDCLVPVKSIDKHSLAAKGEIVVNADSVEMVQDKLADFTGNVEISNENAQIRADNARIDKEAQKLSAQGKIDFQDDKILVESDDILLDLDSGKMAMNNTHYRMLQFQGRGVANTISLNEEQGILLQDVSFSTCPIAQEDWKIEASSIELKPGEIWGTAKHTRFYIKGVPVLYLPYFSFPVTDQRQSGLLIPEINSSDSTGLSYEQPIYWNIAPNMDATFSPRIMTDRGIQLKSEFRYLTEAHAGEVHFEYMDNDRDTVDDDARYFYRITHSGHLNEHWRIDAELNGLSDDNYIVDLDSDFYNRADTHLFKTVSLNYEADNLWMNASFRDFEVIGDHPSTYRALPEIKVDYAAWKSDFLTLDIHSELALFDNSDSLQPKAARWHIAPKLSLPIQTSWAEFLAESSLLHTRYEQKNTEGTVLAESVDRTLGQLRLYGALALERDTAWFGQDVKQTLEPKIQYLYTSYEDQSEIGLYDTARLLNDYQGLFRGQEFTGLDRISDKNQLTLGVTTRIINENNQEQLRVSLGQIFYFDDNRVLEAVREDNNRSALAAELDWSITSRWSAKAEAQVSSKNEQVERSSVSLEYRLNENKLVQFNHRFVRDLSGERIDQAGITASWEIAENWQWVGRYYRDFERHRTTESYTGVQYDSCCWSIQVVWERHLTNRFDALGNQSLNEYDSGIKFKFAFKGMGQKRSRKTLLNDGLYGYQQPYLLSQ